MTQRANRFQGKGGIDDVSSLKSTVENADKYMGKTIIGGSNRQLDEEDFERMTVKGTCKVLEKEYLRLTAPPRPELVRPQPILEKHLANLLKSWKKGRKHGGKVRDYNWYCSQYKALRQDLQVQRIFNAFAVKGEVVHVCIPHIEQVICNTEYLFHFIYVTQFTNLTPNLLLKKMILMNITNLKRSSRICITLFKVMKISRKTRGHLRTEMSLLPTD